MRRPTISSLQWRLLQLVRKLWFRATLFSLLAIVTALIAVVLKPFLPDLSAEVGANSVDDVLGVIASSMLAVTIFSLSTMVSAYIAASNNVSPRAIRLLTEDGTAHNALGTFIGAFLFSLVGIIALSTGVYGEEGRLVLFAVTLVVVAFVVGTLLHWIDHVSKLGQVAQTAERIELATAKAMRTRHENPYLGGQPLLPDCSTIPSHAVPIYPDGVGYVQHLDVEALSELAEDSPGSSIFVTSPPGTLAEPTRPLAWVLGLSAEDVREELCDAFSIDDLRSYDQDPRFGAAVLAEIASHALSPGINDPGTAIDIIGRAVRVLSIWKEPREAGDDKVRYPQVHVPGIELDELFDDLFRPIARDGAAIVEVGIRLQKALCALARMDDPRFLRSAQHHSRQALERALAALTIEHDKQQLRVLAAQVGKSGVPGGSPGG